MTKANMVRELERLERELGVLINKVVGEGITDGPEPFPDAMSSPTGKPREK